MAKLKDTYSVPAPPRAIARAARFIWKAIGYRNELCQDCGNPVAVVWSADDGLWNRVVGGPGGILCVPCFDRRCAEEGYLLRWVPRLTDRDDSRIW